MCFFYDKDFKLPHVSSVLDHIRGHLGFQNRSELRTGLKNIAVQV